MVTFSVDFMASKKLNHLPLTIILGYKDIQHWNKLYKDPLDLAGYYDPITGQFQPARHQADIDDDALVAVVVAVKDERFQRC